MNINSLSWQKKIALFLCAQTISLFGSSLVQFAIIWYITLTTSSGTMMTLSTLCGFLPQIFIALYAGVWIDRYHRKTLIMLADAAIAVATLILALLFIAGYQSIWLLFIILAIRSAGTGIQTPTVSAIIPQIVPKAQLMRINGISSTVNALIMFISPAASGAIYAIAAIEDIFFIDVATAAIGIAIMTLIKVPKHQTEKLDTLTYRQGLRQGIDYFKKHAYIQRLVVFLIVILFISSPASFMTPLLVSRTFGPEPWRLALNEMTFSSGVALGGVLIAIWSGFHDRLKTAAISCIVYGSFVVMLAIAPSFWLYLIFNSLIGIALPYFNAPITVLLQEKVDPAMHGRVFSLIQAVYAFSLPLGMAVFGPLADTVKIESIFMVTGPIGLLFGIYIFYSKAYSL
jgi:DHA3 family macrolide efflux protein-like MFS transporter